MSDDSTGKLVEPPSITCPACGRTSHHPNDVRERYCGACHAWHDDHQVTTEIAGVDRVSPILEYGEALTYVDETHVWPAGWVERHGRHRAVLSRYSAARGALVAEWSSASAEREAVRSADYATVSGALEVEWDGAAAAAVERITAARRLRHGFVMWPAARGVQWWEWHR